ncbi:MAG: adenine deaminase, partial [Candidatus Lokiarchaeota archaeon]|nr:adenine deaminase [Candidatus Lokiarchaeota archaeon]
MNYNDLVSVARGDKPADLILKDARIINTFSGKINDGDIAIYQNRIAGVGDYKNAKQVIKMNNTLVAPSLIDGHIHLESSMLHPVNYARITIPRGILTSITDLHEITNVC